MISTIHKCTQCGYLTNVKGNLKRHCVTKHSQVINRAILSNENTTLFTENVASSGENVASSGENVASGGENVANNHQCINCKKIFKRLRNLNYHLEICTGTDNSLECHICNKVFNLRSTKSRHIKSCQTKAIIPINNTVNIPTNDNTNIGVNGNNNTINSNNTINNITNNNNNTYNIIVYKPNGNDTMEFITDHITKNDFKSLFIDNPSEKELVENYARQLLSNPMNQCIKKTNMRSIHSQVHVGNNNWHTRHDKDIYPKLVCDVAQTFDEFIKQKKDEDNLIISKRMVKEIERFLDYMSDKGYCNDEILGKEMKYTFKELVYSIKAITFDNTKTK